MTEMFAVLDRPGTEANARASSFITRRCFKIICRSPVREFVMGEREPIAADHPAVIAKRTSS